MSNDPNYNAGYNGQNSPANNSADATHQWNQGRQNANAEHNQRMAKAWNKK